MTLRFQILNIVAAVILCGCAASKNTLSKANVDRQIQYCAAQASKTLNEIPKNGMSPRSIANGSKDWKMVGPKDWTSGFWPGELWYLYEATGDPKWKSQAELFSNNLETVATTKGFDHDLGFQIFNSYGNGFRLAKDPKYKTIILKTADSLATLFNPKVGTILSWPHNNYGGHNTIIDNMMNLELLFWASKNGGNKKLYEIAISHAETTMKNHFRPDYSAYHVVVYDNETGKKIKGVTAQGFSDDSMWARGQAWAIYGFTMVYRETKDPKFLDFAQHVAQIYLDKLPADLIPYWDFNAPDIPNAPRDSSAAAIVASALLELSAFTTDANLKKEYHEKAVAILAALSAHYQSKEVNDAFLLHATGHKPANSEIDCSLIYGDYYYLEALLRLKKEL